MKVPSKKSSIKETFPYLTCLLLLSFLVYEVYPTRALFEIGIETVRSRDYILDGDSTLLEHMSSGFKAHEQSLREFIRLCERIREEDGVITVFSDVDEKILFIVQKEESGDGGSIYYCRFR
ncbi:MAG: hypothetical protein JSV18_07525 [Candidatus Bathyarchaeota archaeon]|nr:MAG: hypothetical protein JSV18_07525 [Candidatus Bathyarchaeota archaeon]